MSSEIVATIYGLLTALSWGIGDFSGGIASKRTSIFIVIIISQLIGLFFLVFLAILLMEPFPSYPDIFWGGLAGICGAVGLIALYRGLAFRNIAVVAPVSAVVSVIIPTLIGITIEGLPKITQIFGFLIAIFALWAISSTSENVPFQLKSLDLPVIAGLGFGLFQVFIDRVSAGKVFWPLVTARLTSICILTIIFILLYQGIKPKINDIPLIALAGIFDGAGNAFFVLATQLGRLDISAILSSFSPAVTVILAWALLNEKISIRQWFGIVTAIFSIILISI